MWRLLLITFLISLFTLGTRAGTDSTVILRLGKASTTVQGDINSRISQELNAEYLRLNPHVRIEVIKSFAMQGQVSFDAIRMALAGSSAPDVFWVPVRNGLQLVRQGFLAPLDDYVAAWSREKDLNRIIPPRMHPAVTDNGHYYFIPGELSTTYLLYRKDRFAEAGLTRPPADWDELVAYARRLTDPATDRYGLIIFGPPSSPAWRWSIFLRQAGGSWFRREADGSWRTNLDTPEAEKALHLYYRLLGQKWERDGTTLHGAARIISRYWVDDFRAGKGAMMFGNEDMYRSIDPNLVGIAPVPAAPGGRHGTELGCSLFGINARITDKRHRDAAWNYIVFKHSRAADSIRTAIRVKAGQARFISNRTLKQYGFNEYTGLAGDDSFFAADSISRLYGTPEVSGPEAANATYSHMGGVLWSLNKADDTTDLRAKLVEVNQALDHYELEYVPPGTMQRRRTVTIFVLFLLAAVMVVLLIFVGIRSVTTAARNRARFGAITNRPAAHLWAWTFMLPAVVSILLWDYYPLIRGLMISCMDFRIAAPGFWVGIDNFVTALWRPEFWQAFLNTLHYVGLTLLLGFFLPVILAILFHEIPWGATLFRTVFYIPAVISALVVTMIWMEMFHYGPDGILNRMLTGLGLPTFRWLKDPKLAMLCVVIPGVWAAAGAGSILYQAALGAIHPHLYEQADIDGAGFWDKFRHVTFASLRPLLIIQFVGSVIGAFHATQRILVMTQGGPDDSTNTLGIMIFKNSFIYMKFGYATAIAWITGAFLIGFTVMQLNLFRRVRFSMRGK